MDKVGAEREAGPQGHAACIARAVAFAVVGEEERDRHGVTVPVVMGFVRSSRYIGAGGCFFFFLKTRFLFFLSRGRGRSTAAPVCLLFLFFFFFCGIGFCYLLGKN